MLDLDEVNCHALGERRMNYLNQIRCILEQMDDTPCSAVCSSTRARPLLEFPGYINRRNPEFKQPFYPTQKSAHPHDQGQHGQTQPCSGQDMGARHGQGHSKEHHRAPESYCDQHKTGGGAGGQPVEMGIYVKVPGGPPHHHQQQQHSSHHPQPPAFGREAAHPGAPEGSRPRCDSFELIGGEMASGCDCNRRNGLQDSCRRRGCLGNPACLTEPEPSCIPSRMLPRSERGMPLHSKYEKVFEERLSPEELHRLC